MKTCRFKAANNCTKTHALLKLTMYKDAGRDAAEHDLNEAFSANRHIVVWWFLFVLPF